LVLLLLIIRLGLHGYGFLVLEPHFVDVIVAYVKLLLAISPEVVWVDMS